MDECNSLGSSCRFHAPDPELLQGRRGFHGYGLQGATGTQQGAKPCLDGAVRSHMHPVSHRAGLSRASIPFTSEVVGIDKLASLAGAQIAELLRIDRNGRDLETVPERTDRWNGR